MEEARTTRLLGFLAPGFLHGMGNAIFAIQGHAHMLGIQGRDQVAEREFILAACEQARSGLGTYGLLLGPEGAAEMAPAGSVLAEILGPLRFVMRQHDVVVKADEACLGLTERVARRTLALAMAEACMSIQQALPTGFVGTLQISLEAGAPLRVGFRLRGASSQLPFGVDLAAARAAVAAVLAEAGGRVLELGTDQDMAFELALADDAEAGHDH